MLKKLLCVSLVAVMTFAITACTDVSTTNGGNSSTYQTTTNNDGSNSTTASQTTATESGIDQLAKPKKGDTIATIKVKNYGEIKIRLFKDLTPKAFENFTTHAKNGYYDGLIFHRVIEEFMIQGGDPTGTGMGGESIWGDSFGTEIDGSLHHYRGALAMAQSSQPNSIGSQFYIVQNSEMTRSQILQNTTISDQTVIDNYVKYGGAPWLDGAYTIFGQVYEGMDVVDKIAEVETDANDKPEKNVVIETIEISEAKK